MSPVAELDGSRSSQPTATEDVRAPTVPSKMAVFAPAQVGRVQAQGLRKRPQPMDIGLLAWIFITAISCGGKPVVGSASSTTDAGGTTAGTDDSTSTEGLLDISCEEAITKEECEKATPPSEMDCAWLSMWKVEIQPENICMGVSSEEHCYSGFVDVQAGGLYGGCCPQYIENQPDVYDAYGGEQCFRITTQGWDNCCDNSAPACSCFPGGG